MVMDMHMARSGKYLITADRDEKIRVTQYPGAFEIESFCLGHTQYVLIFDLLILCRFVAKIVELDHGLLISGGGDGTLCLWDYVPGTLLGKIDIPEFIKDESAVVSLSAFKNSIAVTLEGYVLFKKSESFG